MYVNDETISLNLLFYNTHLQINGPGILFNTKFNGKILYSWARSQNIPKTIASIISHASFNIAFNKIQIQHAWEYSWQVMVYVHVHQPKRWEAGSIETLVICGHLRICNGLT